MNQRRKNAFFTRLFTFLLIFSIIFQPQFSEAAFDVEAESAILVDSKTGKILFQKNIDQILPIASMTKMMSEYLILEAIEKGEISWDQTVPINDFVRQLSLETALSNVPLRRDETYTVRELYETVAIYSANASTIALAELIAGSETAFVQRMNEKGAELSLDDFEFVNSTGLNNSDLQGNHPEGTDENAENMMSARATAKLAFSLLRDYEEVLETAKIPEKQFQASADEVIEMENWNWMLPGIRPQHDYEGVDGLKTGYTAEAGNAFTGTAKRGDMRLISVVMRTDSRDARFDETKKLFDYGFNNFSYVQLIPEGYVHEENDVLDVVSGKEHEVGISTASSLYTVVKNGEEDLYSSELTFDGSVLNDDGALVAPIEAGYKVGSLTVTYGGENEEQFLFSNDRDAVDVVTDEAVEKAGWFSLTLRATGDLFSSVWTSVVTTVKGWFS